MHPTTFSGSCLCGDIAYEIDAREGRFFHCHCSRCQKASGTGHASNIILPQPSRAEWTRGGDGLRRYRVPGAKRFGTVFCQRCGSPLPRIAPDLSVAVIPAGSLDMEPALKPQARIFWDSRRQWSCDQTEIPVFAEYPTSA